MDKIDVMGKVAVLPSVWEQRRYEIAKAVCAALMVSLKAGNRCVVDNVADEL